MATLLTPSARHHVVVFSELSPEQKQNYTKFIIENNVKFGRNQDGFYVASVALQSKKRAVAADESRPQPSEAEERCKKAEETPAYMKRYANLYCLLEGAIPDAAKTSLSDVQLARLIHDIYDDRWGDVQREEATGRGRRAKELTFPEFIAHHFQTRFGLPKLVTQNAVDFMHALHVHKHRLDAEIFSSFLDGTYNAAALDFYLFARHHLALLTKDTLGGRVNLSKDSVWISKGQCAIAAGTIFGSRVDPNYLSFVRQLKRHLAQQPASRSHIHTIEMNEFLLIGLETFQASEAELETTTTVDEVGPSTNQNEGGEDDDVQRLQALLDRVRLRQGSYCPSGAALSPKDAAFEWPASPK
ncbi:Aste57867_19931 [Aphanomyces stellatus]|uniref:Aste57867_19931 protein n=1 Tax=Aphanomyces stellatus TaxID=120398 RepID=A0A485LEH1_9STRA|nr:hypothetical protein As57867_019865 [Aphanomyces stellatus]VFT96629.1 Aste57867_19931 [Aphanomyces stellatus]